LFVSATALSAWKVGGQRPTKIAADLLPAKKARYYVPLSLNGGARESQPHAPGSELLCRAKGRTAFSLHKKAGAPDSSGNLAPVF
jgi:hypothetical protein